jgi:DNA polymerase-3 subunit gamma/tau
VESILTRDAAAGFQCIQSALDSGSDARQFARQVVEYLRGLLLVRMNNAALIDATAEMRVQMADHAGRFDTAGLLEAIRAFNAAAADTRSNWQPGLGLELALAEAVSEKPAPVVTVVHAPAAQPVVHPTAQPVFQPAARSEQPAAPVAAPASQRATANAEAQAARAQTEKTVGTVEKPPAEHSGETTGQGADLGQIRQGWARIRQVVRQRSALTAAALNSCRTFTIKDGILVLGYQNDLLKSKMETEDNLALLKAALQGVLGVSMPVRCVVIGNKTTLEADDLDIDSDGMLRTALDLGGEIVYKE